MFKVGMFIFIPGHPKGQPRARAFSRNGKARIYEAGTAEGWKGQIALAMMGHLPAEPVEGPVKVNCRFIFPRPKNHYRTNGKLKDWAPWYHTAKPDRDNLDKAVLDCLTQLGVWKDDKQVASGKISKEYVSALYPIPGMFLEIKELTHAFDE
jgi:Holliday junction resolvase RusA-like endonuclease